ncbi:LacI family DNA-binding transcriptional regulator [Victivallis sp. Marseille-Q1083]|uniref:LacI family DNA-binding transcriptional regulator n=1 Tax=Victivallis sp. Marseille-Q1083 TaxID=2717288 RepID=UPI00158C7FFB|nr:LacI family DNA-binding transcriptional regulator [Victivallis sp. Marseille-Q1083]
MAASKVRLSDIAREANVSLGTVAKVLSGAGGNIRVGEAKAELIRATAKRLNYRPNIAARTLAGSSGRMIGVMIDSNAPKHYYNTIFSIERELAKSDYRIIISESHDNVRNFIEGYRTLLQYGVDGVICVSHDYPAGNQELNSFFAGQPNVVMIGRPVPPGAGLVEIDWAAATCEAATYLLNSGRRHLALIVDDSEYVSRYAHEAGFLQAIAAVPPASASRVVRMPGVSRSVEVAERVQFVLRRLPEGVDGILVENDLYGIFMIRELKRLGFRVPEDVAVIGHDNELFAAGCEPPLASIDECCDAQAAAAVKLVLEQLDRMPIANRMVTVTPKFIWRDSAG